MTNGEDVGLAVGFGEGDPVGVGVTVGFGVAVGLGVGVGVTVGFGVTVGLEVGVGVTVGFGVTVGLGVGVGVTVGLGVAVAVGAEVAVGLGVAVDVGLGVAVGLGLGFFPTIIILDADTTPAAVHRTYQVYVGCAYGKAAWPLTFVFFDIHTAYDPCIVEDFCTDTACDGTRRPLLFLTVQ